MFTAAPESGIREYAAEHDWLTIVQLPTCAPDLNPVEDIWSLPRRAVTTNTAFTDREHLVRAIRSGTHRIQRNPCLIDGCLVGTGLVPCAGLLVRDGPLHLRFPRDAEDADSGSDGTHERTCDHGCTPEILARVA